MRLSKTPRLALALIGLTACAGHLEPSPIGSPVFAPPVAPSVDAARSGDRAANAVTHLPRGPLSSAERRGCDARGGVIEDGLAGEFCVRPTADAGAACADSSACDGLCLAPDGATADRAADGLCAPQAPYFGCYATVENGRAGPVFCID